MNFKHLYLFFILSLFASAYNIEGIVWNDLNKDWKQDTLEPLYPNAKVELYNGSGIKINETTTNNNGQFQFQNFPETEYLVKVVSPTGAIIVTSPSIELWLDENRTDINFGLFKTIVPKDFIIYEDAEDLSISRWSKSSEGNVSNILDITTASHVINFNSADLYSNPYTLNLNNQKNFNLSWDMKTTEGFIIDILVNTTQGERFLRYDDTITIGKDGVDTLLLGLGYTPTNGQWNTIVRDLEKDLKTIEPSNQLLSIQSFIIRANAKIDNIELFSSPLKLYENAEDGLTERWSIYSGDNTATVSNNIDTSINSKIISLQGNSYAHQYIIGGDYTGEANAWNDKKNTNIQWSMKNGDGFIISLVINTQLGVRYINYFDGSRTYSTINGDTLVYGLGSDASNNKWHIYIRNIKDDLLKLEPTNKLLSIEGLIVTGSIKIDDLELFHILHPTQNKSGISLTFDDTTINSWFNSRTIFNKYQAKGTFFVSHFYSLDTEQINKLKILESDGSEIGCHTHNHKGVSQDFHNDVNRITEYIQEQIKVPYDLMKAAGFNPVSFAYPYGEHQKDYDVAVRAYFPYIRLTFDDFQNDLSTQAAIYHNSNNKYITLAGAGIDKDFNNSITEITKALIQARRTGNVITFYAHDITNDLNKHYNILPQMLEEVIENASNLGLKFYTYKEAYQIGNKN